MICITGSVGYLHGLIPPTIIKSVEISLGKDNKNFNIQILIKSQAYKYSTKISLSTCVQTRYTSSFLRQLHKE